MKKYRTKSVEGEAVQWFKMGDHPEVVPYGVNGKHCLGCGEDSEKHGAIEMEVVCPGDWIFKVMDSRWKVISKFSFQLHYEEVNL